MARGSRRGKQEAAVEAVKREEAIAPELDRFLNGIDTLSGILEEETALVRKGEVAAIEDFTRRKRECEAELKGAGMAMGDAGVGIPEEGPFGERATLSINRLADASRQNGAALAAARDAVDHVMGTIRKAAAEAGSEGMYARSGRQVEGFSRTMKGFDRKL